MNTLIEDYNTAVLCAVLVAILAMLQSFVGAAYKFGPGKGTAGVPVGDSHDSLPFRMERSHLNMVENIGAFALTLVLAMIIGVSPSWVNWVAVIFLGARVAHWACYAAGVAPLRTTFFAVGLFAVLTLAIKSLTTML